MNDITNNISVVIPAKNEGNGLKLLLPKIKNEYPDAEIIVVNDGSTDDTGEICRQYEIPQVSHPYSMGNGAAIKSGVRAATGDIIVFMDADGQHDVHDIKRMIDKLNQGYEMVVGARTFDSHASLARRYANLVYNKLASFMTGYKIEDLTSGFRVAKRDKFIKFLYLLPNGFSYPTTSTMAFFRSALPVGYVDIQAGDRKGKSHIRLFKDGLRFFIIIVKIGALFSPMRLFLPISAVLFMLGVSYYIYTYTVYDRFTNMSALIILASLFIFLMGIMAEFLSSLHYKEIQEDDNK
jgi:glycosyltransferase involved in cell wall biosynthesis